MKIAAAPVSWGVFEVTLDSDMPSAETFLDDVVELGYAGTESGPPGYLGDPTDGRRSLEERSLDLVGTFLPFDFASPQRKEANTEDLMRALSFVRELTPEGSSPMILLSDDYQREERMAVAGRAAEHPDVSLPSSSWGDFIAAVNSASSLCVDAGFEVAFHPHVGSYVETPEEIDRLVSGLDESLIGLCMDIGHVTFGGGSALDLTKAYADIIRHVHAKDVDGELLEGIVRDGEGLDEAWQRGVFCDLGSGIAQVSDCLKALDDGGFAGWIVVEQDRLPSGPAFLESVRASQRANRNFLARYGW